MEGPHQGSLLFTSSDDEFDPHDHRNIASPTTYLETLVHAIKGILGAGILAMPFAIAKVGFIMGVFGLILISAFATYCIDLLITSQYELCKRKRVGYLTYPQSMKYGVLEGPKCLQWSAKYFESIVDFLLIVVQLSVCCIFVVFIASNIKQVCDHHGVVIPIRLHMCIILIPLIIINLPKNLKLLAPISIAANAFTIIGIILVFLYVFNMDQGLDKIELGGDFKNVPVFIGITLFAVEAVGVMLALEHHMENPRRFTGILGLFSICMMIITVLYGSVGVFGYIKYGPTVKGSITLNLPQNEIKSQITKILLATAVLMSFPLQNFVAYEIVWQHWYREIRPEMRTYYDYALRVILVLIPFSVAVAIPHLGPFLSLFGALCLSTLGVVFPGVLSLCILYPDYGRFQILGIRGCLIVVLGLVAMISGCYISILDIITAMHKDEE